MPKKKKKEEKIDLHKFLDPLMDMTIHNLVGRHAREFLHLLGSKSLLRPCQRDPSIVPDTGRSRVSFVLQFVPGMPLLTLKRNNLFNQGSQGGCPHRLPAKSSWGSWSDRGPLLHHPYSSSPKIGKRLILLSPHSGVHSLIKFCRHPCKRKTLV